MIDNKKSTVELLSTMVTILDRHELMIREARAMYAEQNARVVILENEVSKLKKENEDLYKGLSYLFGGMDYDTNKRTD